MYVEKFVGDSLDSTLKQVKQKLGPDAIILKTITGKGLKGAFKKNKVEITAAISEKSYINKSRVDKVLDDDLKEKFYNSKASNISETISEYNKQHDNAGFGYGTLGLNKVVNTLTNRSKKTAEMIKTGLDEFLGGHEPDAQITTNDFSNFVNEAKVPKVKTDIDIQTIANNERDFDKYEDKMGELENKIRLLNSKIDEYQRLERQTNDVSSISELMTMLKSLGLAEPYVQKIIRKAQFELSEQEIEDSDTLYEFVLREIAESINTEMPKFSSLNNASNSVVTLLISEGASGQSSMAVKLAALKRDAVLIEFGPKTDVKNDYALSMKLFDIKVERAATQAEIYSLCRKAVEKGKTVFIDYKNEDAHRDETKQLVDGLKRIFKTTETMLSISAIHSEAYNRRILETYNSLVDGLTISHLDQCLNYGALVNLHAAYDSIPMKFFGTGRVIPEDIESATAERIIAGMFKF